MKQSIIEQIVENEAPDLEIDSPVKHLYNMLAEDSNLNDAGITTGPSIEALRNKYLGKTVQNFSDQAAEGVADDGDEYDVQVLKEKANTGEDSHFPEHARTVIISGKRGIVASQG